MNAVSSRFTLRLRRTAALGALAAAGFSGVSCVTYPPPGEENVFRDRQDRGHPRYGYGGSQSPNARPAVSPRDRPVKDRDETRRNPTPDIRRDANDTTVDVTPPSSSGDRSGDSSSSSDEKKGSSSSSPPPEKKPPMREDLPFGQPVIGRPGMVYSPYSTREVVDVKGLPAGTKVECPYTKKSFRVP